MAIQERLRASADQLTFNPDFDLDANAIINNADYFAFKKNFGKKLVY